jgi:hypothetical protein
MNTRLFTFAGGETGVWRVVRMDAVAGASPWNPPARRSRWLCFAAAFGHQMASSRDNE